MNEKQACPPLASLGAAVVLHVEVSFAAPLAPPFGVGRAR